MEILKPNQLKEKFNDPWIAPYQKVLTMVDGNKVEIVEFHPCISGSHWLLHQYKNNSDLIDSAYRDGNKHVYSCHIGCAPLDLKASFNAAGIDEIVVDGDEVKVTHAGLAGAGVGAGMCRGMGEGVKYIELLEEGGGSKVGRARVVTPKLEKVVIGVDDTDVKDAGATWTMAHNLGVELKNEGFEYLDHVIVQLYPHNPHKTQNCVSIALTFAVPEDKKEELTEREYCILIASLLYSLDKCANTVGHYEAYFKDKELARRFVFELITPYDTMKMGKNISIFREDSNLLARKINADVVYIDPPYSSRQYSRFYHVLENITKWEKPQLSGTALKPPVENMSAYCSNSAKDAFADLIGHLQCKYIIVSYNNTYNSKSSSSENKMTLEDIEKILKNKGNTVKYEMPFKAFNAGKTDMKNHKEILFITEVGKSAQTKKIVSFARLSFMSETNINL